MNLSDEQRAIVESQVATLAVEARAGAGKTTVLACYARARPKNRMLYVAFNKSVADEAGAKFPPNVVCRTAHALAYRKAVQLFGDAVKVKVGNTYPSTIGRRLRTSPLVAVAAIETLGRWFNSTDDAVGARHVPVAYLERIGYADRILDAARHVWAMMLDPSDAEVRAPHDGYLKLWQLDQPQLKNYEFVLVDEAQDVNPCIANIVGRQSGHVVWVGDPHQSLYLFRGATDAMSKVDAEERLHLTRSFRFGEGIASVASDLLADFKGEARPILGAGQPRHSMFSINENKSYAFVARTNAAVFAAAVERLGANKPLIFVGGIDGYRLDKILDAQRLASGQRDAIRDPYLRSFATIDELTELADSTDDFELKFLGRIVDEHGPAIPSLVEAIRAKTVDVDKAKWDETDAIFLTTAHKAKGMEFAQVWMADDYTQLVDERGHLKDPDETDPQEINALYVALTRARARVRLCVQLEAWQRARAGQCAARRPLPR